MAVKSEMERKMPLLKVDSSQPQVLFNMLKEMNIAEGTGKNTDKDFTGFLDISLGSAHELEYCCLLAKDLGYLTEEQFNTVNNDTNQVKAMLIGLIRSIRK